MKTSNAEAKLLLHASKGKLQGGRVSLTFWAWGLGFIVPVSVD